MTTRRAAKKTAPKPAPVEVKKLGINHLHPVLRAEVLRLAEDDTRRIEVRSATEAVIR